MDTHRHCDVCRASELYRTGEALVKAMDVNDGDEARATDADQTTLLVYAIYHVVTIIACQCEFENKLWAYAA